MGANDKDDNEGFLFNKEASGQNVAKCIRAATEPMLANHFGEEIVEELFRKYAENVGEHLAKEKTKHVNITISMTKMVKINLCSPCNSGFDQYFK